MWHASSIRQELGRRRCGCYLGLLVLAALGLAMTARAQRAVDPRATFTGPQDGRLLDANPSLTGGRYNFNAVRPTSPLMMGNLAASGLLGRGYSLRVGSPIPSATGFRASLGSGTLSAFRRDSVSVADAAIPYGMSSLVRPYLDPATTVVNPGLLRGYMVPGLARSSGGSVRPLDLRIPVTEAQWLKNPSYLAPTDPRGPGAPGITPPVPRVSTATASSIFGTPAIPDLPRRPDRLAPWAVEPPDDSPAARDTRRGVGDRGTGAGPMDGTRAATRFPRPSQTPLDLLLGGKSSGLVGVMDSTSEAQRWTADGMQRPGLVPPPAQEKRAVAGEEPPGPPRVVDPSVLPGYDVFTDMRLALALEKNPGAVWFEEMRKAAQAQPELSPAPEERAAEDAAEFLDHMLHTPLRTLQGQGASVLNEQMLKAESLMAIGHYREAADRYEAARLLAPNNPLPLIGKGHALLAAGSYSRAAGALLEGLERFPEIARFRFDLNALLGGGEQVDIRRADIMRRLRQAQWPELYFLLGYLEYHSGDRERGLANLDKAAELDRMRTMISRYPALLRGEGVPPLPKLAPGTGASLKESPPGGARGKPDAGPAAPVEELVVPPPVRGDEAARR